MHDSYAGLQTENDSSPGLLLVCIYIYVYIHRYICLPGQHTCKNDGHIPFFVKISKYFMSKEIIVA